MRAKISSIRPAGAEYKLLVPPAETLVRVAVANPACQTVTVGMEPGNAIMQAVMRKRERSRAPLNILVRGGRAFIVCAQGNTRLSRTPVGILAPLGSKTTACIKGPIRELGKSLRSRRRSFRVGRQGVMSKSTTSLPREIRCFLSSREVR
jgi:hypothetical protein